MPKSKIYYGPKVQKCAIQLYNHLEKGKEHRFLPSKIVREANLDVSKSIYYI